MRRDILIVSGLALLFFFPFLGSVHLFDPLEINFAECAREMLVTGDWVRPQLGFRACGEMPPFFFWMQALSMKIFGVNEFAARFPNAICGWVTLLLVYRIGLRLHDRSFAWIWVLAWLGSFLPHAYFRSGLIDPWFNLFFFCGLYGFIEFRWQFLTRQSRVSYWRKYRSLVIGGGLLGLAILTEGIAAYLVAVLVLALYWARYRFTGRGYMKHLVVFSAASLFLPTLWLGVEASLHGFDFTRIFLAGQSTIFSIPERTNGEIWGASLLLLFLGGLPVSIFALPNLWGDRQPIDEVLESDTLAACQRSDLVTWMQLVLWTSLVLFGIAPTKMAHFASLGFFPITYLGAVTVWRAIRWDVRPRLVALLLPILLLLVGLAAAFLPWLMQNPAWRGRFFSDTPFSAAALEAEVGWSASQGLPGLILIGALIAGLYFWRNERPWLAAQTVFGGGAIFTKLVLMFFACNVEGHTQRAAVEFYKNKRGEPCAIHPSGFESYAPLFYAQIHPDILPQKDYFVAKTGVQDSLIRQPGFRELYHKNGFVFFEK